MMYIPNLVRYEFSTQLLFNIPKVALADRELASAVGFNCLEIEMN